MKRELIAYAAGLFDGEGYVSITTRKSKTGCIMQIRIGIAMTDPDPLVFMQKHFSGTLHSQKRKKKTHKPLHQWVISSQKAASFLRLVRSYLLVKGDQADIALKFQSNVDKWNHKLGNKYKFYPERDSVFSYRKQLSEELRKLKLQIKPLAT